MPRYLIKYRVPFRIGEDHAHARSIDEIVVAADRLGRIDAWIGPCIRGATTRVYATARTLEDAIAIETATGHLGPEIQKLA